MRYISLSWLLLLLWGCNNPNNQQQTDSGEPTLFSLLPASETGISFRNDLKYDRDFNIYKYRNFYNGGGVALGDINNDGLPDVYFTSNMGQNKLYLNKGNFKFEDITQQAGVTDKGSWSTGVSMADLNGDGWLDIYVCNSGTPRSDEKSAGGFNRENELFINNQNGTFTERAKEFGLADQGLTTHTAFFDYDKDGDLDAYVLNNSFRAIGSFDLRQNLRNTRDSLGGHKFFINNSINPTQKAIQPIFSDASLQTGILGSVIAFGLGVTVGDIDWDGWQDIYVSNDFFEKDYLYKNNKKGGFDEVLEQQMRHISAASMGADMADINNDAYPDIFVTDMLPEPDYRLKTTTSFDSPDRFKFTTGCGYYNQFTRNMLHLNNANGTFSDIACLAGAEATDWSWGALMVDLDNDGWRDIFVANGIAQDLTNQDYLLFASDPTVQREIVAGGSVDFKRLIDSIPSEKQPNYAFRNNKNLSFTNVAKNWGLAQPSFSNGSAYGDLDNDGDLDLVVNNANMDAFVYRNESDKVPNNHYIKFELKGEALNTAAFGAKIVLRAKGQTFYVEQMPMRGFQSCMDPRPNFGLGDITTIDSVIVLWPTGNKATILTNVAANQTLKLSQAEANAPMPTTLAFLAPSGGRKFKNVTNTIPLGWTHQENEFNDWDRDRLLPFKYSTEGPRSAVGDLNGDGLEDVFICGAANQSGVIFFQQNGGKLRASTQPALVTDAGSEDVDAACFDADGDGDLDLYVASGGNEMEPMSPLLGDRLYINNGKGQFERKKDAVPEAKPFASGCVKPGDFDRDGDMDIFVGMRLLPAKIGVPVGGFLLINDGKANYNISKQPVLSDLGMIGDAAWDDIDGDKDLDLVVAGEWLPLTILLNNAGILVNVTQDAGLSNTAGLWKRIMPGDFNGDGKTDFIVGNMGLNSRLDASTEQPLSMFFNDFDTNGSTEQFLCRYNNGMLLPYMLRSELVSNIPALKKKYLYYKGFTNQKITDIFKPEQMKNAVELKAGLLSSGVLMNLGGGKFSFTALSNEAQFAPIYGICIGDFDADGKQDALTGGNFLGSKPEFGYLDADYGLFLKGDGKGGFTPLRSKDTNLKIDGEVRDIKTIKLGNKKSFMVLKNNAAPDFWQ